MNTLTDAEKATFITAAEAVCRANAAKAEADKAEKEAKAAFKTLADLYGEQTVVIDGGEYAGAKVAVTEQPRTSFDADALRDLVGKGVFYAVTERSVVRPAFQEAVRNGRIVPEVADKVTSTTLVERVTVTIPKR